MLNKNSMASIIAVAAIASATCTLPAMAQYYNNNSNSAVQNYLQWEARTQPFAPTYTPNINGVPLDPNVPRSGLNQFGQPDGSNYGYNNYNNYNRPYNGYNQPYNGNVYRQRLNTGNYNYNQLLNRYRHHRHH
jgi:hypothetical protein